MRTGDARGRQPLASLKGLLTLAGVAVALVALLGLPGAAAAAPPECEIDPGKPGSHATGLTNVSVEATDPSNTMSGKDPQAPYCVGDPAPGTSNGKLLVMLPGSGAVAPYYREILVQGAALGFHVIGLSYPNGGKTEALPIASIKTQGDICTNNVGAANGTNDCYAELAQNRLDGTKEPHGSEWGDPYESLIGEPNQVANPYPGVNSIEYRLRLLLGYLSQHDPGGDPEGWAQFITGSAPWWGAPVWSKMVLGGHSQGGGMATYISKTHSVLGVVALASPEDTVGTLVPWSCKSEKALKQLTPAQWLGESFETAHEHEYQLGACYDAIWPWSESGMQAIGMLSFGEPTSVDTAEELEPQVPTGTSSHWFTTTAKPTGYSATTLSIFNHDMPAVDEYTPWCAAPYSSIPFLASIWDQMLLRASGSSATAPYEGCKRAHLDEAPGITAVSPNSGSIAGGTTITISGKYFTGATTVTVVGTPVSSFTVNTDSEITAKTAAHAAGKGDVKVTTPGGTSPTVLADKYTYH